MTIFTTGSGQTAGIGVASVAVTDVEQWRRAVVCTYFSRVEAQNAVERLVRSGITLESVTIEQENLRLPAVRAQKVSLRRTVLQGSLAGAGVGLLLSLLLGWLSGITPNAAYMDLAPSGLLMGLMTGLSLSFIFHTLSDSKYDRFWCAGLAMAQYNVAVEPQLVGLVQRILFPLSPLDVIAEHG